MDCGVIKTGKIHCSDKANILLLFTHSPFPLKKDLESIKSTMAFSRTILEVYVRKTYFLSGAWLKKFGFLLTD